MWCDAMFVPSRAHTLVGGESMFYSILKNEEIKTKQTAEFDMYRLFFE